MDLRSVLRSCITAAGLARLCLDGEVGALFGKTRLQKPVKKRPVGRPSRISREAVLEVAEKLIGEQGLAACTMANMARQLNVSAMALYTYFPSRDILIEGVGHQLFARLVLPSPNADWKCYIREWMLALDHHFDIHPAARELLFAGNFVPQGWWAVWLPIVRILSDLGLAQVDLAFAARWFGRIALEAIGGHHKRLSAESVENVRALELSSLRDRALLDELLQNRDIVSDQQLMDFTIDHILGCLEKLVQERSIAASRHVSSPNLQRLRRTPATS